MTEREFRLALKSLNKGESPDIYGVTDKHLFHASHELPPPLLTVLMNNIFAIGIVSDSLWVGVLTPVFKKKGSSQEAKNSRGITITIT